MLEKLTIKPVTKVEGLYKIESEVEGYLHSTRLIAAETEAEALADFVEGVKLLHDGEIELPDGTIVIGTGPVTPAEESAPTE